MEPIVGIDLGTTNSEIAYIFDGQAEVLTEGDDGIVPSYVGIDDDGNILVGAAARNQLIVAPERTVGSIKRLMGDNTRVRLGDDTYLPQEISAIILKSLKHRAERVLEQPVHKAVITVPAYFTDTQRQATREAGRIAGLEVVRIINEPTAAALAYETGSKETETILVYDLGGGTFDVSIVKIESGIVEVMATTGDNHLGGDDFDQMIADRLAEQIETGQNISVRENPSVMHRLRRAAESAKIGLSTAPYAMIEEDHIASDGDAPVHLSYELTRTDFEEMIEAHLLRTMDAVSRAMKDAGVLPADIDKIILVGGSTRIPKIAQLLEEKTGMPPHGEVDPDLCVALGAALQAGREMGVAGSGILIDITPYTFGTSAVDQLDGVLTHTKFVPLLRRNTKLPASRSEVFYTMHDGQEAVEITVYQGENPDAVDNVRIGAYHFDLSRTPMNSPIILRFDLDINGILKLEATEKASGRKLHATIENAISRFTDGELIDSENRINRFWGEPAVSGNDSESEGQPPGLSMPAELQDLVKRAEASLETAPAEDRDEIVNLIEDIRDAVREGRTADGEKYAELLEDILFYVE